MLWVLIVAAIWCLGCHAQAKRTEEKIRENKMVGERARYTGCAMAVWARILGGECGRSLAFGLVSCRLLVVVGQTHTEGGWISSGSPHTSPGRHWGASTASFIQKVSALVISI